MTRRNGKDLTHFEKYADIDFKLCSAPWKGRLNLGVFLYLALYGVRKIPVDARMISCHLDWKNKSIRDELRRQCEEGGLAKYITIIIKDNIKHYLLDYEVAKDICNLDFKFEHYIKDHGHEFGKKHSISATLPNASPNKAELSFDVILQSTLPGRYEFVGDRSLMIGEGDYRDRNPDWARIDGTKKYIEYFGPRHIKEGQTREEHVQERREFFQKYGGDCYCVWFDDWDNKVKRPNIIREIIEFDKDDV